VLVIIMHARIKYSLGQKSGNRSQTKKSIKSCSFEAKIHTFKGNSFDVF